MQALGEAAAGLPLLVGTLVAIAILTIWIALTPRPRARAVDDRLDEYLDRSDVVEALEMERPFAQRALAPVVRRFLRAAGSVLPQRNLANVERLLTTAGRPGGMAGLDFYGLRLILALGLGALGWLLGQRGEAEGLVLLRNALGAAGLGFVLPLYWLRRKARARQNEVQRALPDALDMLTIGVEAGLAFESAMLRVGEQWDNALSREFRGLVNEMRLGKPRSEALRRMADRCNVADLTTFVAILVQSNQLGVSIATVLRTQAEQMRLKRRQMAEEKSRQASVKIVVVVAFFILPSLFIVILGPALPRILDTLSVAGG